MKPNYHSQSGVSVTEVLIVLVVAAILFTASVAMFGRSTDNLQRQNAARGFKNFLERARFDSVKRRATTVDQMATVRIIDSDTFSYTIDLNQNGRIDDPSETIEVNVGTLGNIYITGTGFVYPITIQFDHRGQIQAFNGAAAVVQPLVYFCNGTCTPSTANSQNSNIVYVSPTGTVSMMKGGSTIPTFDNPPVTNVPADLSVNPLLVEWEPSTSTPAPTATPTPEPSPTGSPTATPTATPWTEPSGSPTPTPVSTPASVCESGQNISTGCTCVAPMWVRSNGKCR